jgi:hypothetical protein
MSSFDSAISNFGQAAKAKLGNPAILGEPKDQLRAPLEQLIEDLAVLCGYPPKAVSPVGETHLAEDRIRPDYAITLHNALVGFVEVKAPGKGANPNKFSGHDKAQWQKLKSLPNVIYTDGNSFSLWQNGELQGKIVHVEGDIETSGATLSAPMTLLGLFSSFFSWDPIPPTSPQKLAEVSARLCLLLREEVAEQLARNQSNLVGLKNDWRKLLFPEADDKTFADGYAQAVTFGLLIARARDIPLKQGVEHAASELRKSNSLIGTALGLLTNDSDTAKVLRTSLETMRRVLDQVNWSLVSKGDADAWLYFYEHFLEVYDNKLRKQTGSYYTPPEVVTAMVRMVDEVLRGPLFQRNDGYASADVTVADPAVGTGTFLLGVLRRIAETAEADGGKGMVPGAIEAAAKRLIGFELQFGPFAVAQLRLIAELSELMSIGGKPPATLPDPRLYITDTLGNPFVEEEYLPQVVQPIAKSRRDANRIKREENITVVIGNPPYKDKALGLGGWIESGSDGRPAAMDHWTPPKEWKVGAHAKHLKNLYVFFWRWATWKVFGTDFGSTTGKAVFDREGVVCFISAAGFLGGDGFQGMREQLRRDADAIWVIDCSPEGHQPDVPTRIFQGVQQPVCIVLAARTLKKDRSKPATVRFRALQRGPREQKFAELAKIDVESESDWVAAQAAFRAPFLPRSVGNWATFVPLTEVFLESSSGVLPGRTWVVAPDRESLALRWERLVNEKSPVVKEELFFPTLRHGELADRHTQKVVTEGLAGHAHRSIAVAKDQGPVVKPTAFGFRSFDRQWLIPDNRLLLSARPELWESFGPRQVFLISLEKRAPSSGPSITISGLMPDMNFYKGSNGGRVFPLWSNEGGTESNLSPTVLQLLADAYSTPVAAPDLVAYLAAVLAHPAFTARFAKDLVQPGLRVPLTADPALFSEAVSLGREVVWLHALGERFDDTAAGRPKGAPRLSKDEAPTISASGMIPGAPEPLPDSMRYDAAANRLHVGTGYIDNVTPAMWAYEVSGKQVVWQWFSYRRRDRSRPIIGDRRPPSALDLIQPDHWLPEYTKDLIDLLNVLGRLVKLEPRQADLLQRILDHPLITVAQLHPAADNTADS